MPFYRDVMERRNRFGVPLRVVVVSTEPREIATHYLAENAVAADLVVQVDAPDWKEFLRTPTVIHVDTKGNISGLWTGRLTVAGEKEVLAELHLLGRATVLPWS
jgi:hypothetical protein